MGFWISNSIWNIKENIGKSPEPVQAWELGIEWENWLMWTFDTLEENKETIISKIWDMLSKVGKSIDNFINTATDLAFVPSSERILKQKFDLDWVYSPTDIGSYTPFVAEWFKVWVKYHKAESFWEKFLTPKADISVYNNDWENIIESQPAKGFSFLKWHWDEDYRIFIHWFDSIWTLYDKDWKELWRFKDEWWRIEKEIVEDINKEYK